FCNGELDNEGAFMNFAKRLYLVAVIFGLVVLIPQYFMEAKIGHDFPPPITHPEHFYGFLGVALSFQIVFFILSRDPIRYRAMMIPAVMEKTSFGLTAVVLYMQQRVPSALFGFGIVDLIFGVLFIIAYIKTAD